MSLVEKIMINKFEKLNAWKVAKDLAILVYSLTDCYPKSEQFALTSQTTRAVVSIPSNISEGSSRSSKRDFSHFLEIAIGSAFELITLLGIAFQRHYFSDSQKTEVDQMIERCIMLIYGLKRSLNE